MKKVLMLHGANANMFQYRNPALYGGSSLEEVNAAMQKTAAELGIELECYQSNHAGDIIDKIHEAFFNGTGAVIINPGAFTNCDCGVKEALAILKVPVIELHMANLFKKKNGMAQGTTTMVADAVIMGMQLETYPLAIRAAYDLMEKQERNEQ